MGFFESFALLLTVAFFGSWREVTVVDAFPSQAGGCKGGEAAVGGSHKDPNRPTETGSIEGEGYVVAIDNETLAAGSPFTVIPGTDHEITLTATNPAHPIKGFLFRVGWPEQAEIEPAWKLTPGTAGQDAFVCVIRAVGVCHTDNAPKTEASATFRIDEEVEGIALDVTVVLENGPEESEYFYTGYELNSLQLQDTPVPETAAPTVPKPASDPPTEEIPETDDLPSDTPSDIASDVPSDTPSDVPEGPTTPTPPPRPCDPQEEALMECYSAFDGYQACDSCVATSIPSNVGGCDELSAVMCTAITDCECSPCEAQMEGYLNCAFNVAVGCPIVCDGTN